MAMLPGYAYAKSGNKVYVNMFVAGEGTIKLKDNTVRISQATWYPWDGLVKMTVEPAKTGRFTIAVRIPGWAQGRPVPSDLYRYMDANDQPVGLKLKGAELEPQIKDGFACIEREWKRGDVIELELPMPARRVIAHPSAEADKNRVAIERGPIVYCAEWRDNDANVLSVALADDATLTSEERKDLLGGITAVRCKAQDQKDIVMIPYYAWANREQGPMAVWLSNKEPQVVVEGKSD
jgi:DUF1680 family protein